MGDWQLQTAKNNLSEVVDIAVRGEPQVITRHGKPVAVVLSIAEYRRLTAAQGKLSAFFRNSPLVGVELDLTRDKSMPREAIEP